MSETSFQLAELLIAKEDGRSTARLFTASPTPLEEKNLGKLFALVEIDSQDTINEDILDIIIGEVNANYYQSESFDLEPAFEHALQKTNQRLQQVISEVGEEWLQALNVLIGVQKGKKLVFTSIGRVFAFMIHNNKVIDVLDSATGKAQEINPVKIFTNVMTGELTDSGTIVFATDTILDYLSKEKIRRILSDNSMETAIDEFHNLLDENTTNSNFAALILKRPPLHSQLGARVGSVAGARSNDEIPVINRPQPQSIKRDSMRNLVDQQSKTQELLTTSLWPGIKKGFKSATQSLKRDSGSSAQAEHALQDEDPLTSPSVTPTATAQQKPQGESTASRVLKAVGRMVMITFGAIVTGIKWLWSALLKLVRRGKGKGAGSASFTTTRRPRTNQQMNKSLAGTASGTISKVVQWFKGLSLLQKVFFALAVIVLLIFAQSVVNRGTDNNTSDSESQYADQIGNIDIKVNEGKAAMLYDRDQARTLLLEARGMLDQIPKDSDSYKERGEELARVITEQLQKLNNVIVMNDLSPVVDYSQINPQLQLSDMILLGASMYGFDKSNSSVYRANLENQGTTVTISDSVGGKTFTEVVKASPGTGITVLSDNTFASFNPISESLSPLDLGTDAAASQFVDLNVFGTRLYTLDIKGKQIFRHTKSGETFGTGTPWLEDTSVDLSTAVSFTIDGDIYVLHNNGSVTRLRTGARDGGFTLSGIDPALTAPTKIFTDENTTNVYILDPVEKRVVVFDKSGKLVAQYTSNVFDNLIDFVVDEANNKMYILNGTKLYELQLQSSVAPADESASAHADRVINA